MKRSVLAVSMMFVSLAVICPPSLLSQVCSEAMTLRTLACPAGDTVCVTKGSELTWVELDANLKNLAFTCNALSDGTPVPFSHLPYVYAVTYGVIAGDGLDDLSGIEDAIDALPAAGGKVYLPCGDLDISNKVSIGNGSASAQSTIHNIFLEGCGGSVSPLTMMTLGGNSGTRIRWNGAAGGTMVEFLGPMSGGGLSHLTLIGNHTANIAATFLNTFHHANGKFYDVAMYGYSGTGIRIDAVGSAGLPTGVVIGGDDVVFNRVYVGHPTSSSAVALDMGPTTIGGAATDNARHSWSNAYLGGGDGVSGRGAIFRGTDNNTFTNVFFVGGNSNTSIEVIPPTGNTAFPLALTFLHGIINGNVLVTGTWTPPAGNGLLFYPLAIENGSVPNDSRIRGFAGNAWFGPLKVNDSGYDADVSIEGDTDANLLTTDASVDRVGIGTASPVSKLDVGAGGVHLAGSLVANGYDTTGWAGLGAEIGVSGGEGLFSAYNRTSAAYQPVVLRGSTVTLRYAGSLPGINIDASGNILLGGATAGSSAAKVMSQASGTAPTSSPADTVQCWTADSAAGDAQRYCRNEAGEESRLTGVLAVTSADFTRSVAVLASITGLTRNVEAGKTYTFEAVLPFSADVTSGHLWSINGTATATDVWYEIQAIRHATPGTIDISARHTALGGFTGAAGATSGTAYIRGAITVNVAGTIGPQFSLNSGTSTGTVRRGASFRITQK